MAGEMTGAQKAAMLLMALEDEQAAAVLKHMSDSTVARLREAVEQLDVSAIGTEQKRQALLGFLVRQRQGALYFGKPDERFRRVLARAKGEEHVRRLYAEKQAEREGAGQPSPLEALEQAPDEQVAAVVEKESPRCSAVLLSRLSGAKAGSVLNLIGEEEVREQIVERMISTEAVPPEVAERVIAGFRARLEELGAGAEVASEQRRAQELAGMISRLDRESQDKVLSKLGERDPELAARVEQLVFGFGDLLKVSNRSMQELLRNVEVSQIAMALKGAPDRIRDHINNNLSQRLREQVEEEREMTGRVPLSQVEEAREEIMKVARKMYREGQLVVEMGDEQYVE